MQCRIVPFVPGRRPTDEDHRPGFGSSDTVALVTGADPGTNRAVLLVELSGLPEGAELRATIRVDGRPLARFERRAIEVTGAARQRVVVLPEDDLAGVDLGFAAGFLRRAQVDVEVTHGGRTIAGDRADLVLCDVRNLGSLYERVVDRVVVPDAARQAAAAGLPDPGPAYHPWYPVLLIGGEKAALYSRAVVADIVGKQHHLTDPSWLLRVGVYLELLTCLGIFEAVKDDLGDLLDPGERAAFDAGDAHAEIRARVNPAAWRKVWSWRRIAFPGLGTPRTGPVSVLNLLFKKEATMRFLQSHHDDLKHAIELAGPNRVNSQETWQRVFRDAERAVLRKAADAFPELGFLPAVARDVVLWQRFGLGGQLGLYPTACNQYRSSMNAVAAWAKARGLMDHAGAECVPRQVSLLEAHTRDPARVEVLQRHDGLGPSLEVCEPAVEVQPTIDEVEALIAEVPIFRMMSAEQVRFLALGARPLLLGPTQRLLVEGQEGTSLFLVGQGEVEVRQRRADGSDRPVAVLGRGDVVGEMALLTGEPRSATVRSVDESIVYEIGRHQYVPLLRAHPEWLDELALVMEQRLARRRSELAEVEAAGLRPQAILERIRHSLFG